MEDDDVKFIFCKIFIYVAKYVSFSRYPQATTPSERKIDDILVFIERK